MHPSDLHERDLLQACDVRRQRRSGPGGQHRNKVETAIVLLHRPSGTQAEATERRSQAENQRMALRRLRVNLALQVRSQRPAGSIPSTLWTARCPRQRIAVSLAHDDFPSLLAEALDVIAQQQFDLHGAAQLLGTTPSQLVRFLKLDPKALLLVNQQRQALGLHKFH